MFRYIIFIYIQYSALFSSRLCILGLFVGKEMQWSQHPRNGNLNDHETSNPTESTSITHLIWKIHQIHEVIWETTMEMSMMSLFFNASWRAKVTTWMYHEIRMPMSGARQVESPTTEDVQSCRAAQRLPCQTAGGDRPKATCLRFKHVWLQFWKRAADFWIHDSGKHLCITCPRMYD